MSLDVREEFRRLLEYLCYASPAYNAAAQMLFLLPQKAKTLMQMFPELMEKEEKLMELFYLRYSSDGSLYAEYGSAPSLGHHLAGLYRSLFRILADAGKRSLLLELAGMSEEEFKKIDPLRGLDRSFARVSSQGGQGRVEAARSGRGKALREAARRVCELGGG
jgi:hypothetical protein